MKKLVILLFMLIIGLFLYGSEAKVIDGFKLENRNGIEYIKNKHTPFTGKAIYQKKNGEKKAEINYINGKRHGISIFWYNSLTKKAEINYKNGEENEKCTYWYKNGQKQTEVNYISWKKEGKYIEWDKKGNIIAEKNYKDGEDVK